MSATNVIKFWFEEIEPKQQFSKDREFDELVRVKFGETYQLATQGLLYTWREHALDALAEIIVLDQLLRNMFRGTPKRSKLTLSRWYWHRKRFVRSSIKN